MSGLVWVGVTEDGGEGRVVIGFGERGSCPFVEAREAGSEE